MRGAEGDRAPLKFGGSEKGRSLISTYQSLTITTNTPGFKALSMVLIHYISRQMLEPPLEIKILRPTDLNYRIFLYAFQMWFIEIEITAGEILSWKTKKVYIY